MEETKNKKTFPYEFETVMAVKPSSAFTSVAAHETEPTCERAM